MVRHHGKHFEATSKEGTEHFMTFLEQCQSASTDIYLEKAMPSRSEKNLDRCDVCPSWSFLSKTEKGKHYQLFHPKHKIPKSTSTEKKSRVHKCNYKGNGIQCNALFPSYQKLKQHKDLAQHKRSKSLNKVTVNKRNNFSIKEFFQNNITAESPDGKEEIDGEKENEGKKENEVCAESGLEDSEISEDEDEEDLETSWVEGDVCKRWFHLACLGMTNTPKLFTCESC